MAEAQPGALTIWEMMTALSEMLSTPASEGREQYVAAVRGQLDAIIGALSRQIEAFGADGGSGVDCVTLSAVRETLGSAIGDRLDAAFAGDDATVARTLASMAAVCTDEGKAISMLMRPPGKANPDPDPSEPPLDAWMITLRRCAIDKGRVRTEYTRPDQAGADAPAGIGVFGLSTALALLRTNGIKSLVFDNAAGFTLDQRTWLANSARKVFLDCGSRANLLVNATVCVPAQSVTMYTHLSFFESGCRIRFESYPVPVVPSASTAGQAKAALIERYKLKAIEEDGGVWTLAELDQLTSALAKVPAADAVVLAGCTFVRRKTAAKDTDDAREAGSYRFTGRTITLLDAAFCADDYGFVAIKGKIGPYSHWIILHEVGHAVEMYRWEQDYRQWDAAKIKKEIEQLQARKQALQAQQAQADASPTADMDPALPTLIRELAKQISECQVLEVKYGSAQIEMLNAVIRNQSSSACLQAFVVLVNEKRVPPCTGYAHRRWNQSRGEFFADAYSLFLNEPEFLNFVSKDLHQWFASGGHRKSW
jgi:hypothetical protein